MIKYFQLLLILLVTISTNPLQAQNDTTDDTWRNDGNNTITDSTVIITDRLGIGPANMTVQEGLTLKDKFIYLDRTGSQSWRIGNGGTFWIQKIIGNNTSNVFRIDPNGYVGIGTGASIAPIAQLHAKSYNNTALLAQGGVNQGDKPIFQVSHQNNEPLVSVLATRRMGLGTTVPTATLQISTSDSLDYQDYSGLKVQGSYNTSAAQIINQYEDSGSGGLTIETTEGNGTADALRVVTYRSNSPKTMFRIPNYSPDNSTVLLAENGGNVGIGTSNPEKALDVCGHIRAKEVVIESDWCDYVFNKNYQLPTLVEQANFIENNGHLKNFDSEKEMEGEIQVADVTKKQQQTVEEMMLYLIEMDKKMTDFQKENERLQARIIALEKQLANKK